MILEALYRLAAAEELVPDSDYELKPVPWLVRIAADGRLLGIEDTRTTPPAQGRKAPRPVARSYRVPRQPIRTSGDKAFFLCDKPEYSLGLDVTPDAGARRAEAKLAARFALFRASVDACLRDTGDEGVRAVATFLGEVAAGRRQVPVPADCGPGDLVAFLYAPDADTLVHDRPAVREWWRNQRRLADAAPGAPRCVITGQPVGQPALFPLTKRLPGGTASGVSLVSFNASAFESYGWKSNENAPISRDAAEAVGTALNRLVHPAFPDPRPESQGQPLPRRHVRLASDTLACFWADRPDVEFLDELRTELDPEPQVVGEMIESPKTGEERWVEPSLTTARAPGVEEARLYALVITGTQGRAIIRSWIDTTVRDAQENLGRYWDDLAIVLNAPPPKGKELPRHFPQRTLLTALAPFGRFEDIPAALAADLFRSALSGERYPLAVLQKALERARAEIGRSEWGDLYRRDARAALVKAVLVRNFGKELTPAMDPENTEPGYLLGRMMAVLERLQQLALGADVNATVIDRYFGAASATPQSVFPRLLKNARHHARKAGDTPQGGTAIWLDRQLDAIAAAMKVDRRAYGPDAGFPAHLSLEQQGLFVLGYHQQRHWLRMKKEDRELAAAGRAQPAAV
jgi:CRISPR-associated protein Csd1